MELLADPEAQKRVEIARAEAAQGDVLTEAEVRALVRHTIETASETATVLDISHRRDAYRT